jgi:hypothetical protein
VLLTEHEMVRDDVRATGSLLVGLVAAVTALLVGIFTLLVIDPDSLAGREWVYAVIPAFPLVFGAYGVIQSTSVVVRTYYGRAIERELQRHVRDLRLGASRDGEVVALRVPSWAHLELRFTSPLRSGFSYSLLYFSVILAIDVVPPVVAIMSLQRTQSLWLALVAGGLYLALWLAINVVGVRNVVRGYRYWSRVLEGLPEEEARELGGERRRPRMRLPIAYLILPRPNDLVKTLLLPFGALVAGLSSYALGARPYAVWEVVLFWAVLEFAVYEARYMLNDARDRETDRRHLDPLRKTRCPIDECEDPQRAMQAVFRTFVLRIALAIAYAAWLFVRPGGRDLFVCFAVCCAAIIFYSTAYERQRTRTSAGGHRRGRDWLALWLLVGCGYGLRVATGVYLGLGEPSPAALAAAGLGALALGTGFVTMTWALEGTCFVGPDGHWMREMPKPHLRPLLMWALAKAPSGSGQAASSAGRLGHVGGRPSRALQGRIAADGESAPLLLDGEPPSQRNRVLSQPSWRPAPWDWATLVSIPAFAALSGVLRAVPSNILLAAVIISLAFAWSIVRLDLSWAWVAAGVGAAAATGGALLTSAPYRPLAALVALLTWLLPCCIYLAFRGFSYEENVKPNPLREVATLLRGAAGGLYKLGLTWFSHPRRAREVTAQSKATDKAVLQRDDA